MRFDVYRVTLFKRKLREILGAGWVRFYYSKGRCHLCIMSDHIGEENCEAAIRILKRNRIEFKVQRYEFWPLEPRIRAISIPIDQEALPERRRS